MPILRNDAVESVRKRKESLHLFARPRVLGKSRITRLCAHVASSTPFEALTLAVILANAVVLGLETYDRVEDRAAGLLNTINYACLAYFVVEIVIRLLAHGSHPGRFFTNGWNVFDFLVVGAALVPGVRENTTLLRVVRLTRVFRLISVLPEMRILIRGIATSFAPLISMGFLTFLLFYTYGMVGWILFEHHDPGHFANIGKAMLTLFSVLTLEAWVDIQDKALLLSDWAWIYFVSFVLLSSFVLLNMVIAVVINSVEEARAAEAAEQRRLEREEMRREHGTLALVIDHVDKLRIAVEDLEHEVRQRGLAGAGSPRAPGAAEDQSAAPDPRRGSE